MLPKMANTPEQGLVNNWSVVKKLKQNARSEVASKSTVMI